MEATHLADHATDYAVVEQEPPEVLARNLVSAGQLLASATAFFFVAFVFAYFYLESLNNNHEWKPKGVDTAVGWGVAITACFVASATLVRLGLLDHRAERRDAWRVKGGAALALGLAGLVLQAVAWTQQGFGPADGAFASVYVGWTAFQFLFVVATLYWLETTLAMSLRYRPLPIASSPAPGEASGDPHRTAHDIDDPLSLARAELSALSFYWTFLAGLAVVSFVILYLL